MFVILSGCAAHQPLIQEEDLLPSETMLVWEEILVDLGN
jgi:hypothetical protein